MHCPPWRTCLANQPSRCHALTPLAQLCVCMLTSLQSKGSVHHQGLWCRVPPLKSMHLTPFAQSCVQLTFLQGLPTIRAYGAESHFQESFISHLSLNGQWWYAYLATARWIGFRLDLIATITLTVAVLLAMAVRTEVRRLYCSGVCGQPDDPLMGYAPHGLSASWSQQSTFDVHLPNL
jgi:hypothetical protein